MNKVFLVGRLTRDPELRTFPAGRRSPISWSPPTSSAATGRRSGPSTTTWSPGTGWPRSAASSCAKGQLVDVEGRLQTRQWDDDAGIRHWKTEVVIGGLEMLSGRGKKEYAKEAQAVAATGEDGLPTAAMAPIDGAAAEALVAM